MRTIWKFGFAIEREISVEMPEGAVIVSVQLQCGNPCMWAIVDSDAPLESRKFKIQGTGHAIENPLGGYLGTFQTDGGAYVWHLFRAD